MSNAERSSGLSRSGSAVRKPPGLKSGDRIGLIAPSSPFREEAFQQGIAFLEKVGFAVHYRQDLLSRRPGFLAGDDACRAEEFMSMFRDPSVRAVFAVRGGYGAQRILHLLDCETIQRNPKLFLGYSDSTVLLNFLLDRCGMACCHGPLVTEMGSLSRLTEQHLLRVITQPLAPEVFPMTQARWIREGEARGVLVGGNLSVLCSTLGTPWEVNTTGRILFLEDRGERPYRVDRMLVHMRQAGKFDALAGLVFGDIISGREGAGHESPDSAMFEVLRANTCDLSVPVLCGLPVGHGSENLALPVGLEAELSSRRGGLNVMEGLVEEGGADHRKGGLRP